MQRTAIRATFVAAVCCLLVPSFLFAQPGGGRGNRGGPGGPGGRGDFFGGGVIGLVQQPDVQREIELSEDQESQLRALNEAVRDEMRGEMEGMFNNMRDLSDDERRARFEEIRARMEEFAKDAEARMQNLLMPHQFERLKQIDLQSRIQRGGAAALSEGELAETLGLTDAQREQLRERAEQVEQDLQDHIRQLRLDARKQLLEVLTGEQRARLESMLGAEFDLPQGGPGGGFGRGGGGRQFGFGGRGDRGGRGGDRNRAPAGQNGQN